MQSFGVIGLGRIGGGLALQALGKGLEVAGFDPAGASSELQNAGIRLADNLQELVSFLGERRIIFLYIHAGELIDQTLEALRPLLKPGDIVVDGGNSYWGDSIRRANRYRESGLHLVDLGTSGGVIGALTGACFMAGGDESALDAIEPILGQLATPGGVVRCGESGSGHYVKLVHNGIEFGMLQAIGEGLDLLSRFDQTLPMEEIVGCWRNGSVIRSWLVDLLHEQMVAQGGLDSIEAVIEDTGEVNWLVADAMRLEVPIPVISQSVMQLFASRDTQQTWAKGVAMMRHGFGGHPYGRANALADERQSSRIGDIWRPSQS